MASEVSLREALAQIRRLIAEKAEQAAEIELLKAWMASDERAKIFAEQAAEIERLREALQRIAEMDTAWGHRIARAALKPAKGGR